MTGIVNSTGARSGIIGTTVGTPTGGNTHASQWRLHTGHTGAVNPIASSNIEAVDTDGGGIIGAVMTNSRGIWTFPATGIWKIEINLPFYNNAGSRNVEVYIYTT